MLMDNSQTSGAPQLGQNAQTNHPEQNVQLAQNPQPAPTPKPHSSNKPLWITFAVLGVAIVGLGIANAVVAFLPKTAKKVAETPPATVQEVAKQTNDPQYGPTKTPIDELDEEEAIEALVESYEKGYTLKGLIDEALVSEDVYTLYRLGYSYDDPDNITVDNNFHTSNQYIGTDLEIEPTEDGYVLVTSAGSEEETAQYGMRYLGYAFDEQLLDYRPAKKGETTTEALSSDNLVFNTNDAHLEFGDTSFEFIRKALPMVMISAGPMSPGIMGVYDYEFEENDDGVTLTLYYLTPETDYESTQEAMAGNVNFLLSGYAVGCTVNTETGEFAWVTDDGGKVPQKVASVPLSKESVMKLQEINESASSR